MKSTLRTAKGQSLVEFALILPLFILLVVGMTEFGRAWMTKNILTGAAREAVRAAAVETEINAYGSAEAIADSVLGSANIPITFAGDAIFDDTGSITTVDGVDVPIVFVRITYDFPFFLARFIPGLPDPITLSGTATMRRERY